MKLQDFINTVTLYEQKGELEQEFWGAHKALGNYLTSSLDPGKLAQTAGIFLRKWNKNRGPVIDWERLADVWDRDIQNTAQHLSQQHLEDSEDDKLREADKLYRHLLTVRGIGDTNASKLLALSFPELCIMWDKGIREEHPPWPTRHSEPPRILGRYYHFLVLMRKEANDLIQQCMQQRRASRKEAIIWLRQLPLRVSNTKSVCLLEKPLAKLLDEYNYGKTRSWDCRVSQ